MQRYECDFIEGLKEYFKTPRSHIDSFEPLIRDLMQELIDKGKIIETKEGDGISATYTYHTPNNAN